MRKYEIMYILNANVEESERAELIESFAKIITDFGGKITKTDEWGMRDFAYEINKMTKGYYVVMNYESENEGVAELNRLMKINANVVRFMNLNMDEEKAQGDNK